ncbi:glycosyltransferase family 4 protein, partial [Peribacillus simplex]|uniref:glycosyltransferase family 4 protein n=1 Tax=Peribacillus simplex TaxID=1478 RepID=UPI001595DF98
IKQLVAVSPQTAQYVTDISGRKDIQIIPNGIIPIKPNLRECEVIKDNMVRCVFVGSLISYKGVHIAIEAISKAVSQGIEVGLDIIGDGPERKKLISQVREKGLINKVNFLGVLSQQEVRKKLLSYDISLIPSIPYGEKGEESFPYACLESMDAGLLTIASRVGGLSKIITDNYNGCLVEHSNSDAISSIISSYYISKNEYDQIKKKAKETIEQNYSATAMAGKYLDVYKLV